jgi:hypothetical protein
LRQSKNHTVTGENRRHIVLIHSSLLSVRNYDASRFGDIPRSPGTVRLKTGWISAGNSLLPETISRLTVIESVSCYTPPSYWEIS